MAKETISRELEKHKNEWMPDFSNPFELAGAAICAIFILLGGAIGGALGALSFIVIKRINKLKMGTFMKVALAIVVVIAGVVMYIILVGLFFAASRGLL